MRESDFEKFLISDNEIVSKEKAVRSRISKAKFIEKHFNLSLDEIVASDELMFNTLIRIKKELKDKNGAISNSLRKYYQFIQKKQFPQLAQYHK